MSHSSMSRLQSTLGAAMRASASHWPRHSCFLFAWCVVTNAAHAQTAPVIPGANAEAAASGATAQILLNDELETDTKGIETSSPTHTLAIVGEKEAHEGLGALRWNYVLDGDNMPQIGLEGGAGLAAAGSVRFWLKTAQPAAIAMWFETAREAGVDTPPQRLVAHFWSRGGDWQAIELSRDRFVLQTPAAATKDAADNADTAPDPDREWSRIARYGVMDVTNFWLKRAGQPRLDGARSLWLDSVQVSTAPAANAPIAAPVVNEAGAAPADTLAAEAPVRKAAPGRVPPRAPNSSSSSSSSSSDSRQVPAAQNQRGVAQDGDKEFAEEEANEAAPDAAPVDPPIIIAQDAYGDGRLWIPINGQTTDSNNGLEWNLVRLANRNLSLMMPVAPQLFTRFPLQAIQLAPKPKAADLKTLGKADRWVRLVLDLSTQKATRINVAVVERGGAVYSMTVPVDQRRKRHRQTLPLPRFQLERTSRDANNQIDLDQIEYLSVSDVGAQTGTSGPNLIRINGLVWMY